MKILLNNLLMLLNMHEQSVDNFPSLTTSKYGGLT